MTAPDEYTLDVIIFSNPATIDRGNGKPYWIFEVHVTGSDAEHDYSPTDRAYMTLTPGQEPGTPRPDSATACAESWTQRQSAFKVRPPLRSRAYPARAEHGPP